jgi:hydrophobic/amphiphilic exporter-1 (mainly G- bacteria), HAE1 family
MSKLPKVAVQRPVTFLMISIIIIGFGLFGLSKLRLNLYPDVSFPTITIYTTYEGVAPEDIETLITRPLEEGVGSTSGVLRVRSLSSQGASVVKLYFDWGTDLYIAESDVRKKLDGVRRSVPQDAEQPIIFTYDPNQEPVVVLTLTSNTRSARDLRTLSTQIVEQRLERIPGVASAETSGGLERQINVWIRNDALRAFNLDIGSVANRLRAENVQIPAGELTEGRIVYSLRTIGEFKDINQIRNTVIGTSDGNPIRLMDVAEVLDDVAQPIGNVRVNGDDGVVINIYKQSESNVVTTADEILNNLDRIKVSLPQDVSINVLTNRAEFIKLSINNLYLTGLQAILLVMAVLLFFLGSWRTALIVAISIPVSVISTFSIMDWADLSLNVISLSGLTLAVGMVVDNAVVVLENIFRFRDEEKATPKVASIKGAQEVAIPVMMSTLTTLVVFLPILFVPGIAGFLFRDLALTISFALIMSTFIALSLIPVLSSRLLKSSDDEAESDKPGKIASSIIAFLDRLDATYARQLTAVLKRKWLAFGAAVGFFLLTLPIFSFLGGEFFPPVDESAFVVSVEREPGVNIFELGRTIETVENIIKTRVPEARLIVSDYGDKIGVEGAEKPGGYTGVVRVELVPTSERNRSQFEITADLLSALESVPGAEIKEEVINPLSPDGESGLVVNIYGYDQAKKKELSDVIKERIAAVPGIASVFSSSDVGRPELRIVMDRERISRNNMNTQQVANAVGNAVKGSLATTFVDQGIEYSVMVQLHPDEKTDSEALENIQLRTPAGTWMPLNNLARIERFDGPSNILRINQERITEIKADLGELDLRTATEKAKVVLNTIEWPEGYRYEIGGSAEEQADSFSYLLLAFMIAAVLTYMVMASQFESFSEPFIIIATIPLALSGVLIILLVTGTPISVTSMVGLILLTGIVVNNGIVMIDYIKILQVRGLDRFEAIVQGATRRLRPILMTALTTILSMVPLALELGAGSETWSPMARTVIGGLTMSTFLMLFVVPSLYLILNEFIEKLGFDPVHKIDPLKEEEDL